MSAPSNDEDTLDVGPRTDGRLDTRDNAGVSAPKLERGDRVGRYLVSKEVGAGGMGSVYLASDPDLDRDVAIKVVKVHQRRDRAAAHARLLREAQALAQLSHPSVVTVYDAATYGDDDDAVYLAMEFVEGENLGAWVRRVQPPRSECLQRLVEAAQGLAAAHRAGIVHRDFKPSNVMLGADGRVRVLDFGLARGTSKLSSETGVGLLSASKSLDVELTGASRVIGTPAFMAPEQFLGEAQDERTDQFSFCVTAYRLLFGYAPFDGDDVQTLRRNVVRGMTPEFPQRRAVPRRVWRVLVRGMSLRPDDRYPDMSALVTALRGARVSRVKSVAAVGAVGVLLAGGAWVAMRPRAVECDTGRARAAAVWDSTRSEAVHRAFAATERSYAELAHQRVVESVDAYVEEYADARQAVCQSRSDSDAGDPTQLDAVVRCLDRHLTEVDALLDVFAEADAQVVEKAPKSVLSLPPLVQCQSADRLDARAPTGRFPALEADLARATALTRSGRIADALQALAPLLEHARGANGEADPQFAVRTLLLAGETNLGVGDAEQARAAFSEARQGAAQLGNDDFELSALLGLSSVEAVLLADPVRALDHARHAEALLGRMGDPPVASGRVDLLRGTAIMRGGGDADEARVRLESAIEKTRDNPEALQVQLAALHNLASFHGQRGRYLEAEQRLTEALELAVARLGPDHPTTAAYHASRGATFSRLERFAESETDLRRALAIYRSTMGEQTVQVAQALHSLGVNDVSSDDYEGALEHYRDALRIKEKILPQDHPTLAPTQNNIGDALNKLERFDEAIEHLDEAMRIWELGSQTDNLIYPLLGLCEAHVGRKDLESARSYVDRGLTLLEEKSPASDPHDVGTFLALAARVLASQGEPTGRVRGLVARAREAFSRADRPTEEALEKLAALEATLEPNADAEAGSDAAPEAEIAP